MCALLLALCEVSPVTTQTEQILTSYGLKPSPVRKVYFGSFCGGTPILNPNDRWGFTSHALCRQHCQRTKTCEWFMSAVDVNYGKGKRGDCLLYKACPHQQPYYCKGCHPVIFTMATRPPSQFSQAPTHHTGTLFPTMRPSLTLEHHPTLHHHPTPTRLPNVGAVLPGGGIHGMRPAGERAHLLAVGNQYPHKEDLAFPNWHKHSHKLPMLSRASKLTREEQVLLSNLWITVVVFYGRHKNLFILDSYLFRNLRRNGGVIDQVVFGIHKASATDMQALDYLLANRPNEYSKIHAEQPKDDWKSFRRAWTYVFEKNSKVDHGKRTMWLKIDDDIVYIQDGAIEQLTLYKLLKKRQCGIVSANVVNHSVLASVQQRIGVYQAAYAADWKWKRNVKRFDHWTYEYDPWGRCSLWSYDCARNTHENFLYNIQQDQDLNMYKGFHIWDFHSDKKYDRYSVNVVMLTTEEYRDFITYQECPGPCCHQKMMFDDELCLSSILPKIRERHQCAVADAVMAHFSYQTQNRPRLIADGILRRYKHLSELMQMSFR